MMLRLFLSFWVPLVLGSSSNRGIVFTSFLTQKPDPQRDVYHKPDFNYMRKFYETALEHDVNVVIVHDGLSDNLVQLYTRERIDFVKVSWDGYEHLSTNDFRFVQYLKLMSDVDPKIEHVLTTDISDVYFNSNPFDYFQSHSMKDVGLFLSMGTRTLATNGWFKREKAACYGYKVSKFYLDNPMGKIGGGVDIDSEWDVNLPLFNAGVWGGRKEKFMCLLKCVVDQILEIDWKSNCDMPVYNWCVRNSECRVLSAGKVQVGSFVNPMWMNCRQKHGGLDGKHLYPVVHDKCGESKGTSMIVYSEDGAVHNPTLGLYCDKTEVKLIHSTTNYVGPVVGEWNTILCAYLRMIEYDRMIISDYDIAYIDTEVSMDHYFDLYPEANVIIQERGESREKHRSLTDVYLQFGIILLRSNAWTQNLLHFMLYSDYCFHFKLIDLNSVQACLNSILEDNIFDSQDHIQAVPEGDWNSNHVSTTHSKALLHGQSIFPVGKKGVDLERRPLEFKSVIDTFDCLGALKSKYRIPIGIRVASGTEEDRKEIYSLVMRLNGDRCVDDLRLPSSAQITDEQANKLLMSLRGIANPFLLIWGLGNDSIYWHRKIKGMGGRVVFLENSQQWFTSITGKYPQLEATLVKYHTDLFNSYSTYISEGTGKHHLLEMRSQLDDVLKNGYPDAILVDAPPGYRRGNHGRYQSIYTSVRMMKATGGNLFIDDTDRKVEKEMASLLLSADEFTGNVNRIGNTQSSWLVGRDPPISFVYSCSPEQYPGVIASVKSLRRHGSKVFDVYFVALKDETPPSGLGLIVVRFDPILVESYRNKVYINTGRGMLRSPHNYVRFVVHKLLSHLDKVMWLDADTLVTTDLTPLVESAFTEEEDIKRAVAAFPRDYNDFSRIKIHLETTGLPHYNLGALIFNIPAWKDNPSLDNKLRVIISENNIHSWWTNLGSQPPFNLVLGGDRFQRLDPGLLTLNLGYKQMSDAVIPPGILHWNGARKPWLSDGMNKHLWVSE